jgi:hypothetical protein
MPIEEIIIFGVMLLIIVGSWLGNLIKEAQQREAEKQRQREGRSAGTNLDEVAARRRERLREMARQRQQRIEQVQVETPQQHGYQRYGQLEDASGEAHGQRRYSEIEQATPVEGYRRYDQLESEPIAQPSQYERYRDLEEPTQRSRREPRRERVEGIGDGRQRGRGAASSQSTGASGSRGSGQTAPQGARLIGPSREIGAQAAGKLETAQALQRVASAQKQPAATGLSTARGRSTAAARALRKRMRSANLAQIFLIKELLDRPLAMREAMNPYDTPS